MAGLDAAEEERQADQDTDGAATLRRHAGRSRDRLLLPAGQYGRPFKSTDSFCSQFKKWRVETGLPDLSPHGFRKAAGLSLAEKGATQYGIMAIHGHADPKTSAIYRGRGP